MVMESPGGVEVSLPQSGVDWRIGRFLESHPGAPLTISVRSLTIKGLAWLEPRCRDRRVRIVIGRWRPSMFKLAAAADRTTALALLSRTNVVVRAWDPERQPPVLANARAWVAHTKSGPSVLLCSADLTDKGLHSNWEVVAAAADGEHRQVADQVNAIADQAEDFKDTLLSLVADGAQQQGRNRPPASSPTTSEPPTQPPEGVAERIEAFLDAYPRGRVTVAVGYASVSGLAWLSKRVAGRPVTVFIGNAQHRRFKNANAEDRVAALAFLHRPDVQVRNWYHRHGTPAEAHLKAWIVEGTPPAVLTGSANLTSAGLFNNREVMAEIHGPDSAPVVAKVNALVTDAWPYKLKLIKAIDNPEPSKTTTPKQPSNPVSTRPANTDQQPPRPANTGQQQPRPAMVAKRAVPHRPEQTQQGSGQQPGRGRERQQTETRHIRDQTTSKPDRGWLTTTGIVIAAVAVVAAVVVLAVIFVGDVVCSQVPWVCNGLRDAYRTL